MTVAAYVWRASIKCILAGFLVLSLQPSEPLSSQTLRLKVLFHDVGGQVHVFQARAEMAVRFSLFFFLLFVLFEIEY